MDSGPQRPRDLLRALSPITRSGGRRSLLSGHVSSLWRTSSCRGAEVSANSRESEPCWKLCWPRETLQMYCADSALRLPWDHGEMGLISPRLGFQPDSNPWKQALLLAPLYRSHLRKVTKMPQCQLRSSLHPSFPQRRTKIRLRVPLRFVQGKHPAYLFQHRPWTLPFVKSTRSCHFSFCVLHSLAVETGTGNARGKNRGWLW